MTDSTREHALDAALSQIERAYGKGSVMKMSDQAQVSIPSISTGALSLDVALGIGGLPRGRVVEIFGPESSGKTTLVYHVIAEAQRRGGICAFIWSSIGTYSGGPSCDSGGGSCPCCTACNCGLRATGWFTGAV